ncbi:MAG: hypothetical protein JXL85_07755, partial [Bacilli bacterium]|nr:hypothetical protein [Bacilli bacterium]
MTIIVSRRNKGEGVEKERRFVELKFERREEEAWFDWDKDYGGWAVSPQTLWLLMQEGFVYDTREAVKLPKIEHLIFRPELTELINSVVQLVQGKLVKFGKNSQDIVFALDEANYVDSQDKKMFGMRTSIPRGRLRPVTEVMLWINLLTNIKWVVTGTNFSLSSVGSVVSVAGKSMKKVELYDDFRVVHSIEKVVEFFREYYVIDDSDVVELESMKSLLLQRARFVARAVENYQYGFGEMKRKVEEYFLELDKLIMKRVESKEIESSLQSLYYSNVSGIPGSFSPLDDDTIVNGGLFPYQMRKEISNNVYVGRLEEAAIFQSFLRAVVMNTKFREIFLRDRANTIKYSNHKDLEYIVVDQLINWHFKKKGMTELKSVESPLEIIGSKKSKKSIEMFRRMNRCSIFLPCDLMGPDVIYLSIEGNLQLIGVKFTNNDNKRDGEKPSEKNRRTCHPERMFSRYIIGEGVVTSE